ncbi:right-handed parallel beta-helix repeat-containing protein [Phytohabitans kaempferiae]|uniref:Right-handed parallel beta-helix repeat-containing protein n=1 Tax=Phytohabitans kaempferiae TaxID=1620943 RepID=A0ABV6LW44_9ACTN
MRRSFRASVVVMALTSGTLVGVAAPVQAAATVLYVRQMSATCSDSGAGTPEQPFCTIGAAAAVVTAGQTVEMSHGIYRERVTVTRSGTPDQPITFRGTATSSVSISGPNVGFVIDGQHDIVLQGIRLINAVDVPALDIRNSSAITVEGGGLAMAQNATAPAIRLAGVTASSLKGFVVTSTSASASMTMDAATSGVTVTGLTFDSPQPVDGSVAIRIDGAGNKLSGSIVKGFGGAGVAIEPGATDTLVVNNHISAAGGYGIHNRGATRTAITNNTVRDRCRDGIRVDGASTGVSVQNNALFGNGFRPGFPNQNSCVSGQMGGPEIGVYDAAVQGTVVDYNNTSHQVPDEAYVWAGTRMGLATFRTTSGQGRHDRQTMATNDLIDSANSAAPGYPPTDQAGKDRIDDPGVANTGAGPVTYADRGWSETIRNPLASATLALDAGNSTVTVDATASTPGTVPIASYTFNFGDGTVVTQSSPIASHRYSTWGDFTVQTTVTGTDGRTSGATGQVSVLRPTGTWGLLFLFNLRYATVRPGNVDIVPENPGVTEAAQFDVVDAGAGRVALFSRATRRYVTDGPSDRLRMTRITVGDGERFTIVRNADGSISLRSVIGGRYVSILSEASPFLAAHASTIGIKEKFHQVKLTDAGRTFKAHANGKFVSAESWGTKPLIASRPAASTWETFDIVDLGNGQVALFARANNHFVAAEGAGAQPLQAKRLAVSTWERFTMIRNSDGSVSFRAAVNNRYVAAEGAGTKPLLAGRTAINTWEKFTLG